MNGVLSQSSRGFGVLAIALALAFSACGGASSSSKPGPTASGSAAIHTPGTIACKGHVGGTGSTPEEAAINAACSDARAGNYFLDFVPPRVLEKDGKSATVHLEAVETGCKYLCPATLYFDLSVSLNVDGVWDTGYTASAGLGHYQETPESTQITSKRLAEQFAPLIHMAAGRRLSPGANALNEICVDYAEINNSIKRDGATAEVSSLRVRFPDSGLPDLIFEPRGTEKQTEESICPSPAHIASAYSVFPDTNEDGSLLTAPRYMQQPLQVVAYKLNVNINSLDTFRYNYLTTDWIDVHP